LQILALDVFNREAEGYNTHFTSGTVLLKRQQSEESYFALHILAPRRVTVRSTRLAMLAVASFVVVLPPMLSLTGPYRPRYRDGPPD
jgi:hypothetical protein